MKSRTRPNDGQPRAQVRWLRPGGVAALLLLAMIVTALPAQAAYTNYFPPQPGFTHSSLRSDDIPPGLGVSGAPFFRGGPAIAEVDGNTGNGKEIVIGGRDGRVYVYRANGTLAWQKDVLAPCTLSDPIGDAKINSVPAVGALYGDGVPYVVVGYGTVQPTNCQGGVVALRGSNGQETWRFNIDAVSINGFLNGVASSPALGDVNHDGTLEVAFGAFNRTLYMANHDGSYRWSYDAKDTVWSSPSFANIDGDPDLEMIVGTDITGNPKAQTQNGGYVYAFDTAPSAGRVKFGTGFIWRNTYNQTIYSSPAVADVDGNGSLEVVIGSGCFYNNDIGAGRWVKVLSAATGAERTSLNALGCTRSSPAVGDLDGDGELEVAAVINGQYSGQNYSWVQVWDWDNPTPKWTSVPKAPLGGDDNNADDLGSPVIADLDGNGSLEVIAAYFNAVAVFNGKTGAQLTCTGAGCGATRALFTWMPLKSTPAVGDLDGDGDLELVAGGSHAGPNYQGTANGFLYVWTDFAGLLGSPAGSQAAYSAPWPQFRGNAQHTGATALLAASGSQLSALLELGQSTTLTLVFSRSDGAPLSWSIAQDDPDGVVQLNRTSGTAGDELRATLTAPGSPGTYQATLTVQAGGLKSLTIPVTVVAADQVVDVFAPIASRP